MFLKVLKSQKRLGLLWSSQTTEIKGYTCVPLVTYNTQQKHVNVGVLRPDRSAGPAMKTFQPHPSPVHRSASRGSVRGKVSPCVDTVLGCMSVWWSHRLGLSGVSLSSCYLVAGGPAAAINVSMIGWTGVNGPGTWTALLGFLYQYPIYPNVRGVYYWEKFHLFKILKL